MSCLILQHQQRFMLKCLKRGTESSPLLFSHFWNWDSHFVLLCSNASCSQMFALLMKKEINPKQIINNEDRSLKQEKEIPPKMILSARIRAAERSFHFSRVLSQSCSGLRPGSSNLLCHTSRFPYRPRHDTAATHLWESTARTHTHT